MKNTTIIFGLISILVLGFLAIYGAGKVGVAYLEAIKAYEGENRKLVEVQQDNLQKDVIIRALMDKIRDKKMTIQALTRVIEDKANCEIVNENSGITQENNSSQYPKNLNMAGGDINRVFQLDVGNGIYNAYEDKVYILEGDALQATRYDDDDNPRYYLDPDAVSRLNSLEITGDVDFLYSPWREYSNSKTGAGNLTVSVSCPEGTYIMSGGFLDDSSGKAYLKASVRSGQNGWMCSSWSNIERTLTCYAYCGF